MYLYIQILITPALRGQGLNVIASQEDGTSRSDDEEILARASELGRVLLTQEQDFLRISAGWFRKGRSHAGNVFSAQAGASIGELISDLVLLLRCARAEEIESQVIYLPLR